MSSVSLELGSKWPNIAAAKAMQTVERKQKPIEVYSPEVLASAKEDGMDMVEHFTNFVDGTEKSFRGYFVISDERQESMHDGFWEALEDAYPDIELDSEHEDSGVALYVFKESGVALIARSDYACDIEGNISPTPFAVNYEAAKLPTMDHSLLGRITVAEAIRAYTV